MATSLPVLLSHALLGFERDYDDSTDADVPGLAVLLNILRVLESGDTDLKAMPTHGRITTRAVRIATQTLERAGWLTITSVKRGLKLVSLTPTGEQQLKEGLACVSETETMWQRRYGKEKVQALRNATTALVRQIDIELPHFPSGYGQGDTSIHGGSYITGQEGPPKIPGHGAEWNIVLREDRDAVTELPLCALLSQALCAFAIDYDENAESVLAGLHTVLTYLRYVDDEGIPLERAKALGQVNGTGRAGFERHKLVTVEAKVAYLTNHGKRVRDRYPKQVVQIEKDWQATYGKKTVDDLRHALETIDAEFEVDLPDYVDTSGWLSRS
ncbi:MAG: hypothetical protein AAF525_00300 [Pseudomonadota bacterium]